MLYGSIKIAGKRIAKPATIFQSYISQDNNAMSPTPSENITCKIKNDLSLNFPINNYFKNV